MDVCADANAKTGQKASVLSAVELRGRAPRSLSGKSSRKNYVRPSGGRSLREQEKIHERSKRYGQDERRDSLLQTLLDSGLDTCFHPIPRNVGNALVAALDSRARHADLPLSCKRPWRRVRRRDWLITVMAGKPRVLCCTWAGLANGVSKPAQCQKRPGPGVWTSFVRTCGHAIELDAPLTSDIEGIARAVVALGAYVAGRRRMWARDAARACRRRMWPRSASRRCAAQ